MYRRIGYLKIEDSNLSKIEQDKRPGQSFISLHLNDLSTNISNQNKPRCYKRHSAQVFKFLLQINFLIFVLVAIIQFDFLRLKKFCFTIHNGNSSTKILIFNASLVYNFCLLYVFAILL
ncbi:hypothetical protein BpHYR1_010604 [Brachionus plicatilis]|uniref:Uncharacterized protein n=1 Tax=Brachionus plicatilis TaxID=10195 RepID=A0A3M7S729_BRAPC|nr:hypothetical protein BpHYR1_010604 [Brachionus plicatilis]